MLCPSCRHENRAVRKFCAHCGAGLELSCPACGASAEPGERFCGECGKNLSDLPKTSETRDPRSYTPKHLAEKILQSKSALKGERKQVTILFADVRGFDGTGLRGSTRRSGTASQLLFARGLVQVPGRFGHRRCRMNLPCLVVVLRARNWRITRRMRRVSRAQIYSRPR